MSVKEISVSNIYEKDRNIKKEDIKLLMQWLEKQPHLPTISELQTILFFHSCHYKIDQTKSTIDTFFTVRTLYPDLFQSRSLKDPGVLYTAETCILTTLPALTPEEDLVFLVQLDKHPEHLNMISQIKLLDAQIMIALNERGPVQGLHIIMDLRNVVFGHFLRVSASLSVIKKFLFFMQEGLPVRLKYVHVINVVPFMDKILTLFKPLIKKELYELILLHKDMESLFKYIPQDMLPEEYGGSCGTIDSLKEQLKILLKENEDFIESQEKQIVDESKRTGNSKSVNDMFGAQGSFKQLELD